MDITGFGLGGHLLEMLDDDAGSVDLDLARAGITSTLLPEKLRQSFFITGQAALDPAVMAVLFDPQTAGEFDFAVPSDRAEACVAALRNAGADCAAIIGSVTEHRATPPLRITLLGELNG